MASLAYFSHHLAAASHGALTLLAHPRFSHSSSPSSSPCGRRPFPTHFSPINVGISPILPPTTSRNQRRLREMSRRNGKAPKVDLKVNLTRPRVPMAEDPPRRSATLSPTSPPSSCISSEMSQDDLTQLGYYSSSPEAQSMVLAGCQRCLMYVMLSEVDPKCPKCQNTVLLEFMQQENHTGSTSTNKSRKNR